LTIFHTNPGLERALAERNYSNPTPVQKAVLASETLGRDILVSAQTGSGKTVAYGLAIGSLLLSKHEVLQSCKAPVALIIAPTRELALQVERELAWLYHFVNGRVMSCVGGMDARQERKKLAESPHIVVGTPGRLRDHIERRSLDMSQLNAVVLDEADEMLDLGFREDLEFILAASPEAKSTLMFSATMPKGIVNLAQRYQKNALRIEVEGNEKGHADIEYRAIRIIPKETEHVVVNLLRLIEAQTSIVFCNTRESVRHLQSTLLERGFQAVLLSGELSQHERNQSMMALRDGRARVCVATDVAARGIDLPNLGLVIHADLPHDAETLQHRSGRTGRAGRKGISALLVSQLRRRRAEQILNDAKIKVIWEGPPTIEQIQKLDQERMLADPILNEQPSEEDFRLAKILLTQRSPEELGAALIRAHRSRLPALEEVSDPGETGVRRDFNNKEKSKNKKALDSSLGSVWFRLNVGRKKNADPKWLLPMLCRKGNINRSDVGIIQIFDNETKIEISKKVASDFIKNIKRPGGDNITVQQIDFHKNEVDNRQKNAPGKNKKQNKQLPTKDNNKSNHDK
jgi:ATP-dependent RNA helicase DeaD